MWSVKWDRMWNNRVNQVLDWWRKSLHFHQPANIWYCRLQRSRGGEVIHWSVQKSNGVWNRVCPEQFVLCEDESIARPKQQSKRWSGFYIEWLHLVWNESCRKILLESARGREKDAESLVWIRQRIHSVSEISLLILRLSWRRWRAPWSFWAVYWSADHFEDLILWKCDGTVCDCKALQESI